MNIVALAPALRPTGGRRSFSRLWRRSESRARAVAELSCPLRRRPHYAPTFTCSTSVPRRDRVRLRVLADRSRLADRRRRGASASSHADRDLPGRHPTSGEPGGRRSRSSAQLGVNTVRVIVPWSQLAPDAELPQTPHDFNATDPDAYPAARLGGPRHDRRAQRRAVRHHDRPDGHRRRAAAGRRARHPPGRRPQFYAWKPNASRVRAVRAGAWARATAATTTRHGSPGTPTARGSASGRSGTSPTTARSLAPQGDPRPPRDRVQPAMYRSLVDAGWNGAAARPATGTTRSCSASSRRGATTAEPRGVGSPGMKPLVFVRALYCVDSQLPTSCAAPPPRSAAARPTPPARGGSGPEPGAVQGHRRRRPPLLRWYPPNQEQLRTTPTTTVAGRDRQPRRARSTGSTASTARAALPDLQHRVRLHHQPAQARHQATPGSSGDHGGLLPQLGRVLSLAQSAGHLFTQYLLPTRCPRPVRRLRRLRQRPADLRQASRRPPTTPSGCRSTCRCTSVTADAALEVWGCARPAQFARCDTGAADRSRSSSSPSRGAVHDDADGRRSPTPAATSTST